MNEELAKKLLEELIPHLEAMEAQNMAILQFLKDKGIVKEKQFAPYLDRAGDTSSVKWLATRLRMEHLISSASVDDKKSLTAIHTAPDQKTQPGGSESAQETASDVEGQEDAAASTANDDQQETSEHREEPTEAASGVAGREETAASKAKDGEQQATERPASEETLEHDKETTATSSSRGATKTEEDKDSRAA